MIEVQCTSCHTRYRIDEQVLPEGTPTFKCSRCGHVFSFDPRNSKAVNATPAASGQAAVRRRAEASAVSQAPSTSGGTAPPESVTSAAEGPDVTAAGMNFPARPSAAEGTPLAEPAPSARPSTAELLSRPFASQHEEAKPGENLTFDFRDENPAPDETGLPDHEAVREEPTWQVGDETAMAFGEESAPAAETSDSGPGAPATARASRRRTRAPRQRSGDEFVNEAAAPIYNRGVTRSARFFLMLFMLVAAGFLGMTVAIHNAPAVAGDILSRFPVIGDRFVPPTTPARLVALREVHAEYRRTRGEQVALVITGTAENVGPRRLHIVQVAVRLRDRAQHNLAGRAVYCGNNLAAKMVGEMTPHEIEFFQKLDPPKSFALEPSAGCPFVLVFIDPPGGTSSFDISVGRAMAAPEAAAPGA